MKERDIIQDEKMKQALYAYAPYNVEIKAIDRFLSTVGETKEGTVSLDDAIKIANGEYNYSGGSIKLMLYPMSCILKEMEYDGKIIIPLDLLKTEVGQGFYFNKTEEALIYDTNFLSTVNIVDQKSTPMLDAYNILLKLKIDVFNLKKYNLCEYYRVD